jgi:hypothetical protein
MEGEDGLVIENVSREVTLQVCTTCHNWSSYRWFEKHSFVVKHLHTLHKPLQSKMYKICSCSLERHWRRCSPLPLKVTHNNLTSHSPNKNKEQQRQLSATATQQQLTSPITFKDAGIESLAYIDQTPTNGRSLFSKVDAPKGTILFSIPLRLCLTIDYSNNNSGGISVPPGEWPRLKKAIAKDDTLPWDVLLAVALLDASAGAGGAFWEAYSNTMLPDPLDLTLPFTMPEDTILPELQHSAIIEAAIAQKQRLRQLFPGLAVSMLNNNVDIGNSDDNSSSTKNTSPTFLEWTLACVRSRSFKLNNDSFSFVPFLDIANHAVEPNCNFNYSSSIQAVQLVAIKDVKAGDELTISYTGEKGYTNQRMMAQYGFVLPNGNYADRIDFPYNNNNSNTINSSSQKFSLEALQGCFNTDEEMVAVMSGRDVYKYAALKSFPVNTSSEEGGTVVSMVEQKELAERLLGELKDVVASWPTTLTDDADLLSQWNDNSSYGGVDKRYVAAVQYRQQRKLLVHSGVDLLNTFIASL